MKKIVPALLALLWAAPAIAETQATINSRVVRILQQQARVSSQDVNYLVNVINNPRIYATAAELLAATPDDGTIGYALDTDVMYVMVASTWNALSGIAVMANGATITNAVDGTIKFLETSEDLKFTATNNLWTMDSSTGATFAFTPAVGFTGDITISGATGGITWSAAGSTLLADNSATSLDVGATGATAMIRYDTTNGAEKVIFNSDVQRSPAVYDTFAEGAAKGLTVMQYDGTAFDGSTGMLNIAHTTTGRTFAASPLGAGQTLPPAMVAAGLDISGDDTDDEGYELSEGWLGGLTSGRPFTIGTDGAFQFCAQVTIADVSQTDDFHVGFRQLEPVNATHNSYTEYAGFGITASAATAAIKLVTELAGGGTTTTDTTDTWADAASKTLCVKVSAAGVVTYTNGGNAPTVTAAFTFSDGIHVVPYIWFIHSASTSIGVVVTDWNVAYQ